MAVDEFKIRQDNTQYPITSILEDSDEVVVDLTSAVSVNFRMSPLGGGATKVDAVAEIVGSQTNGEVKYQWDPADTDTPGFYLAGWRVLWNSPDDFQDFPNGGYILVNVTPALDSSYASYSSPEEIKKMLTLAGTTFLDEEVTTALAVASDALDEICGREFRLDTSQAAEDVTRYYSPQSLKTTIVDDLVSITALQLDSDGDGDFDVLLEARDFFLWPYNALVSNRPYTQINLNPRNYPHGFPFRFERSVSVTGIFGWPVVPSFLKVAASMLAVRLVKRMREAPFGVAVSAGIEVGSAVRIARSDPDICSLCEPYTREKIV